jgi:hypothetical protein
MLKMTHFTGFINKLILKEEIKTVLVCIYILYSGILFPFERKDLSNIHYKDIKETDFSTFLCHL